MNASAFHDNVQTNERFDLFCNFMVVALKCNNYSEKNDSCNIISL